MSDQSGTQVFGSFSVSVTDDKDIISNSPADILSALLLSSELKGYIDDPAYYFRSQSQKKAINSTWLC
ncbi:MAG: hypothetical protein LUD02_16140 [Tannerellaceae bacterium]|nr:hypothetical protein [Tannerellaceae bacterium]MCD8265489.1 hypothetical protein [Tannerellaceae bacterium]